MNQNTYFFQNGLPVAGKKTIVVKATWDELKEIKQWIKEQGYPLLGTPFRVGTADKLTWGFKLKEKEHQMVFKLTWGGN